MASNATPTPKVPHEAIRFAIRENFPFIFEPSHALGDTLHAIRTKINTLNGIANRTIDDTRGQEMTDAIDGLLGESAEVEEQFKVWHEKLNVAWSRFNKVASNEEMRRFARSILMGSRV
ncbi:hypothetical protein J4E91_010191 [Alternaria rosae]|nr:hypothetical protein J4E91_010191 [Alternaria rosae]